jgi:ABC-type lipoprotein release transport system permease subunit
MRRFLYEIAPTDLGTYAGGAALLLIVACAAAIVPAVRATRVDPVTAMRAE